MMAGSWALLMPDVRKLTLCMMTTGLLLSGMGSPAAFGGTIAGRSVPSPIYGVTLDDVSKPAAEVNSLGQMAQVPTARIVFDAGVRPSYYLKPIQQLRNVAYIMGELVDSSYMKQYTVNQIASWTQSYTKALGNLVDIWEIGNEVNGNWLASNTLAKIEAMYDVVSAQGGATALTFFYEGEPSEPGHGAHQFTPTVTPIRRWPSTSGMKNACTGV